MNNHKAFRLLYLLTLVVFVVSGGMLAARLLELRRGNEFYAEAGGAGEAQSPLPAPPAGAPEPEPPPEELPELSARLLRFAGEHPDAAAWLQIPGTPVDYPVMLGTDNQFYLNHLPDGSENALGSLFADFRTGEGSRNLIIYGHNGAGGRMFGTLKRYESQAYYSEHRTLTLATEDGLYVCPVFSVRRTEAGGGAYTLEFEDEAALAEYMGRAAAESLYPIDAGLSGTAGVLTLSTCTGWPNQRFIVQAAVPASPGGGNPPAGSAEAAPERSTGEPSGSTEGRRPAAPAVSPKTETQTAPGRG